PQILKRQLDAGAWGITAATPAQAAVCFDAGARRGLIANQLIAPPNIRELRGTLNAHPGTENYRPADKEAGIGLPQQHWRGAGVPMRVFLEFGRDGWRTGARSPAALQSLFEKLHKAPVRRNRSLRGLRIRRNPGGNVPAFDGRYRAAVPRGIAASLQR